VSVPAFVSQLLSVSVGVSQLMLSVSVGVFQLTVSNGLEVGQMGRHHCFSSREQNFGELLRVPQLWTA
jgi:hypothetical protein